jgi:hypothetical protein
MHEACNSVAAPLIEFAKLASKPRTLRLGRKPEINTLNKQRAFRQRAGCFWQANNRASDM